MYFFGTYHEICQKSIFNPWESPENDCQGHFWTNLGKISALRPKKITFLHLKSAHFSFFIMNNSQIRSF